MRSDCLLAGRKSVVFIATVILLLLGLTSAASAQRQNANNRSDYLGPSTAPPDSAAVSRTPQKGGLLLASVTPNEASRSGLRLFGRPFRGLSIGTQYFAKSFQILNPAFAVQNGEKTVRAAPGGFVPLRPFTLAASAGTVDEDSATIVQLRNFTVTFLPGTTGAVHVRYSITAVSDISRFCPATQSTVRVRFRNSDNSGATANVVFEIHSSNIATGGNNILYTFNSNGRGNGLAFTTATATPAIDFDFGTFIYWIEATLTRSDPNQFADLGSIQIWESAGTACP